MIFITLLLSVSTISAADNATSDLIGVEETTAELVYVYDDVVDTVAYNNTDIFLVNNQEDVEITTAEENTLNTSTGTFTDLANEINNADNELNLTKDYICNKEDIKNYKAGIKINKQIIINGNNHTLNANGLSRIFNLTSNGIIIRNINFINGYLNAQSSQVTYGAGIVIRSSDNLIENCNFNNNGGTGGGSAIYCSGSNNTIKNCNFINNKCYSSGGALYVSGPYNNIINCNFINNTCTYYHGGAICLSANYCIIFNSSFLNNIAHQYGGAIYIDKSRNHIYGSIFKDNLARAYDGGQIRVVSGEHNIFDYNCFIGDFSGYYNGIYIQYSNNNFNNNWWGTDKGPKDVHFNPIAPEIKVWIQSNLTIDDSDSTNVSVYTKLNVLSNGKILSNEDYAKLPIRNVTYSLSGDGSLSSNNSDTSSKIYYFNENSGKYTIKITSMLDDQIKEITKTIDTYNVKIPNEITYENNTISFNLPSDANGTVTININNKNYTSNVSNGSVSIVLSDLTEGNYSYIIIYSGDNKYSSFTKSGCLTVRKSISILSADDLVMSYRDGSAWAVTLTDSNGNAIPNAGVKIGVSGRVYTVKTDVNGVAKLLINLNPGTYALNASFESDDYDYSFISATVTVDKATSDFTYYDLIMAYKDGSAWAVTLTDVNGNAISGVFVKIGINGAVYNRKTDENGVASLPINLGVGLYSINATFEGSAGYESAFTKATVTVNKAYAKLSANNIVMRYKDGSAWIVTLTEFYGGNAISGDYVNVTINNKVYKLKTNAIGVAKLTINLNPGTYYIGASFSNSRYDAEPINATVTVNKATPILAADDLIMVYKDGSSFTVTLTDFEGNAFASTNVKITIGNKTYTLKTDENGVAILPINLPVGKYTVTSKFDGNSKYSEVKINNTITVEKPRLTIVAEDVNMTYQDGTNYTVQITDGDGQAVAQDGVVIKVTINGKSYNIRTNAEGISSLPINLKAGTYDITAEYNGKQINNTIVVNKA